MLEEQVKIIDKYGLPIHDDCVLIKISEENKSTVLEFLKEKKIPNKSYSDAGSAFCDSEAEFRLRNLFRAHNQEKDEIVILQMALSESEAYGNILFDDLCDNGNILDNDYIEEIISKYFKEDFEKDDDDGVDSENERYMEARAEALQTGHYIRYKGIIIPPGYESKDGKIICKIIK